MDMSIHFYAIFLYTVVYLPCENIKFMHKFIFHIFKGGLRFGQNLP